MLQVGVPEELSVWIGVGGAVLILLAAVICLLMVVLSDSRSGTSSSNAAVIHTHVVFCVFMALFAYLLALKLRVPLLRNEVSDST